MIINWLPKSEYLLRLDLEKKLKQQKLSILWKMLGEKIKEKKYENDSRN